jgi:hypothetical protein
MKKIMMVGSALMLLSTSAFATKARLLALGEDKDGSYFVSDYRNVYINPAELNSLKNMAVLEWGNAGSTVSGALGGASLDFDNTPKAEGGVVYSLSNDLKMGVLLGDETDVSGLTRILASNGGAAGEGIQSADNVLDVFVSGKGSINWGANLLYSQSKDQSTATTQHSSTAYAIRLGVAQDAWNFHLLAPIGAKSNRPLASLAPTYKGKFGIRAGGGYDFSSNDKLFGMYENYTWDQTNNTTATRVGSFTKTFLGYGHTQKVSDSSNMFVKLQAEMTKIQLKSVGALVAAKIDRLALPLSVGFEHAATEWLVLRGSVVQNLYGTIKDEGLTANFGTPLSAADFTNMGKSIRLLAAGRYGSSTSGNGGKKSLRNSTAVNAGATLKFASLELDGVIGATPASRTGAPDSTASTNKGTLAFDNLETRVGMTYNF